MEDRSHGLMVPKLQHSLTKQQATSSSYLLGAYSLILYLSLYFLYTCIYFTSGSMGAQAPTKLYVGPPLCMRKDIRSCLNLGVSNERVRMSWYNKWVMTQPTKGYLGQDGFEQWIITQSAQFYPMFQLFFLHFFLLDYTFVTQMHPSL